MSFSCPKCSFTASFESALMMHRQLHHGEAGAHDPDLQLNIKTELKPEMALKIPPREKSPSLYARKSIMKFGGGSSATRILGKLRARICRSKGMFSHPEDPLDHMLNGDLSCRSDCTSKDLKQSASRTSAITNVRETSRDTYACHLCSFKADRITVLDRHLLNDHKIGLDNLLKLVLAKTKDGLSEDCPPDTFGARQPYYRPITSADGDILEDDEFIIETATPKIKVLKHAATNTDLTWTHMEIICNQLDTIMQGPARPEKNDLMEKMETLNKYMCKFVNSSNTLKMALSRDMRSSKEHSARRDPCDEKSLFNLRLEDQETPRSARDWKRAYSDKLERYKSKHSDKFRSDKSKLSAESYYF